MWQQYNGYGNWRKANFPSSSEEEDEGKYGKIINPIKESSNNNATLSVGYHSAQRSLVTNGLGKTKWLVYPKVEPSMTMRGIIMSKKDSDLGWIL